MSLSTQDTAVYTVRMLGLLLRKCARARLRPELINKTGPHLCRYTWENLLIAQAQVEYVARMADKAETAHDHALGAVVVRQLVAPLHSNKPKGRQPAYDGIVYTTGVIRQTPELFGGVPTD